ncbi:hypothetical protein J6O86_03175 [bacterium]|nr:hypothetical protein [bacterium]
MWSAGVGLRLARRAGHETLYLRRCERNESEVSGAIYDCTGGIIPNLFQNLLPRRLFIIFDYTGWKGNKCLVL